MSTTEKLLYNFTTGSQIPINEGGVAFSLLSRDYKDPQCVCTTEESCAFRKQGHPQNSEQGQGWEEASVNDTLNAFDNAESRTSTLVVSGRQVEKTVYDWHRQDTRMTELKDVCVTAAAGWGGGGNNMPYVLEKPVEKEPILLESNQNHATIQTNGISTALPASMGMGGGYTPMIEQKVVVRRLTPLECERLQGYPDGWTDIGDWVDSKGKVHKVADSSRYKALGNSIALPFWEWLAGRMVECLKADGVTEPTMASLFDGIGGFPLVYSRCGCEPIWASEIEEFPIAVTKIRFPECTGDCDNCKYAYHATDHGYAYEESKLHCKLKETENDN